MRRTLVGFQFLISVVLIAATIVIFLQVNFMRKKKLGYDKEQLLVVRAPNVFLRDSTVSIKKETLKTELLRDPAVQVVSMSTQIPGKFISDIFPIRKPMDGPESFVSAYTYTVDHNFIDAFGMKLIAGRDFGPTDNYRSIPFEKGNPVILSELAAKLVGFSRPEEAVGREIAIGPNNDFLAVVVGIVSDFHQRSVKEGYNPVVFKPSSTLMGEYFTVRMDMQHPAKTIKNIETSFFKIFPDNAFSYFFLDDYFDAQYSADQRFQKIFILFSTLSLVVTCMGIFGLSTFAISQRTKEIVIRRIFGATNANIIYLFSSDFLRLVLVANILGLPIAYLLVTQWLQNFAFKTPLTIGIFMVPAAILIVMALLTVSWQVNTQTKRPAESLKMD
jgi:putative ABC transport system permease protein